MIIAVSLLAICVGTVLGNTGVPVLVFRDSSAKPDLERATAGHTIPSSDFSASLLNVKTPELLVVFVQDLLSTEDFLRLGADMQKGGLFQNVQKYSARPNSMFYPSVKSPAHSLSSLVELFDERIELKDAENVMQYVSQTKLVKNTAIIVHLYPTSDDDTSSKALTRNDQLIGEVMNKVDLSGLSYMALYTGKSHRKHQEAVVQGVGRHLLQTEEATPSLEADGDVIFGSDNGTKTGCLVWAENLRINKQNVTGTVSCKPGNTTITITIGEQPDMAMLVFNKSQSEGMWKLVSAKAGDKEASVIPDISAPLSFSFHCNEGLKFYEAKGNSSALMSFKRLQIQVFDFKKGGQFGYAYDCTPFFTITIWTGLLLSLLLISVTIYGFSMIGNIQTFDQYDDPKGKPLVVNISE